MQTNKLDCGLKLEPEGLARGTAGEIGAEICAIRRHGVALRLGALNLFDG